MEMQRRFETACRNLVDASVGVIICEARFDNAYKAFMQFAIATMMENGFHPDTAKPGQRR